MSHIIRKVWIYLWHVAYALTASCTVAAAGTVPCPGLAFSEFSQQLPYSVGVARSLGTGDINGDGFIDAVISGESSTVIYYGSASGQFAEETPITLPNKPDRMVIEDLDADGWSDIVTFGGRGYAIVFSGPEGLSEPLSLSGLSLPESPSPAGLTLGDLNGDGVTDIVGCSLSRDGISVRMGLGDRLFAEEIVTPIFHPYGVDAADLNNDGLDDLVVALEQDDEILVLYSDGDGTFTEGQRLATGGTDPNGVRIVDIDMDGLLDIVANNDVVNSGINFYFGSASGLFVDAAHYPAQISLFQGADKLTVTDLDGDGDLDVVTGSGLEGAAVLLNAGGRSFLAQRRYDSRLVIAQSTAAADVNLDGRQDILVATWYQPGSGLLVVENLCDDLCSESDLARPYGKQDLTDISAFVGLFTSGNTIADLTQDNTLDLEDIVVFINQLNSDCDGNSGGSGGD